MGETLRKYHHKLTLNDKALICAAMRQYGNRPDCHNGVLPFLKMEGVVDVLRKTVATTVRRRPYLEVLAKVDGHLYRQPAKTAQIYLDDRKVSRKFGIAPKKQSRTGIRIPGARMITGSAGVSYNIGKKDYVPHMVNVPLEVGLKSYGKNLWAVRCEGNEEDLQRAVKYLLDSCGL